MPHTPPPLTPVDPNALLDWARRVLRAQSDRELAAAVFKAVASEGILTTQKSTAPAAVDDVVPGRVRQVVWHRGVWT